MLLLTSITVVFLLLSGAESSMDSHRPKEFLISEVAKKNLIKLDIDLINNLIKYSDQLKEKITHLQSLAQEIRQPLEAAKGVEEEYLSNPLHSFPLIRHMFQDWHYLEELMRKPVGQAQMNFLKKKLPEMPSLEDTKDASKAIYRLARTYNTAPWEMENGLIDGVQLGGSQTPLTPLDFFELGKLCFQWKNSRAAYLWFTSIPIFEEYEEAQEVLGFRINDVALMVARCLVELDKPNDAQSVLMQQPDLANSTDTLIALYQTHHYDPLVLEPYIPEEYSDLCQSSHVPSPSRLHCRYNSTTSPFLILAPLKMEEISLDPYIIVYHDVLSVKKTEEIIRWGDPRMEPTLVLHHKLGEVKDNQRTALGTWLSRYDLEPSRWPLWRYLTQRIRDLSGLRIHDEFAVQLIKYGFGAHYAPHFDFFNSTNYGVKAYGDRIATALFYLNDAPHGGATIFNKLNLKVNAERGKVLFWYNLKGGTHDLDESTMHGACPIFKGLKYVMTAWIDEWDQMFIQPTYSQGRRHHFF